MASPKPLKSILKKPPSSSSPATSTSTSLTSDNNPQHLATAVHHATILQDRKDLGLQILLSTETLIDLPTTLSSTPSAADVHLFTTLLIPFTPSDYDDLILERNINKHCGYVLCPNSNVTSNSTSASTSAATTGYRLFGTGGKAKDFKIVKKADAERWCSEKCARKGLWVRVQLSEDQAWERVGGVGKPIELLKEDDNGEEEIVQGLKELELGVEKERRNKEDRMEELATERGEIGIGKGRLDVDMDVGIGLELKERKVIGAAVAPSLKHGKEGHLVLEGHTTRFEDMRRRIEGGRGEDEDTMME